jgi:hypothetical protein
LNDSNFTYFQNQGLCLSFCFHVSDTFLTLVRDCTLEQEANVTRNFTKYPKFIGKNRKPVHSYYNELRLDDSKLEKKLITFINRFNRDCRLLEYPIGNL